MYVEGLKLYYYYKLCKEGKFWWFDDLNMDYIMNIENCFILFIFKVYYCFIVWLMYFNLF